MIRSSRWFLAGACLCLLLGVGVSMKTTLGKLVFTDTAAVSPALGEFTVASDTGAAKTFQVGGVKTLANTSEVPLDSDMLCNSGHVVKTGSGTYTCILDNLTAVVAPVAGNDVTQGYAVGSFWIDTVLELPYICADASAAAAVWVLAQGGDTTGLTGTTSTFYTVNNDAAAMPDADVVLSMNGGGGGAEIAVTTIWQDSSAGKTYCYNSITTDAAGTSSKASNLVIGPLTALDVDLAATLTLNAQDSSGAGAIDASTISQLTTGVLTIANAGTIRLDSSGNYVALDVVSGGLTQFLEAGAGGVVIDHGAASELDMSAYAIRQDDAATHCWGNGGTTTGGCVSSTSGAWLFDNKHATGDIAMRLGSAASTEQWCAGSSALTTDCATGAGLAVNGKLTVSFGGGQALRSTAYVTRTGDETIPEAVSLVMGSHVTAQTLTFATPGALGTGRCVQVESISTGTITVAGFTGDVITGSVTIVAGTSRSYLDVANDSWQSIGGCP